MDKRLAVVCLGMLLVTTAGCSHQQARELDARLEYAENNAAMARLRADEAHLKAELAIEMARKAQLTADEANARARRTTEKATRK
jgi:hypothetical protein